MIKKSVVAILAVTVMTINSVCVFANNSVNSEIVIPENGIETVIDGVEYACYDNIDEEIKIDLSQLHHLLQYVRDGISDGSADFIDYDYSRVTILLSNATRVHAQEINFNTADSNGYLSLFPLVETESATSTSKCLAFLEDSDTENPEIIIVMALGDYLRYMDVIVEDERGVLYAHSIRDEQYKVLTAKNSIQCILIHEIMHIFLPRLDSCHEYIYNYQIDYFDSWTADNPLVFEIY